MNKQDTSFCWWKHGIIYHIYPQSYKDSNQDGTGDIQGIIQQVDYLAGLGIDAIWISPIYESPFIDGGYDIKDYLSINPVYGNLDDFKTLLDKAHKKGIKIIMDMVLNHTSRQHLWFLQSQLSVDNPYREWYIWKPGRKGKRPNNWITNFGQSAWTLDPHTNEYYYHSFFSDQPDLNWRNPDVKKAMSNILSYWLELGVDGFRFDVINMLFKHPEFRNTNPFRLFFSNKHVPNRNQPEVFDVIKELRQLLDSYKDKVSIGEIYTPPPGNSALVNRFLGNGTNMLHLAFDFSLIFTRFNAQAFLKTINNYYQSLPADAWPCFVISNHDLGRNIKPDYFSFLFREKKAKVLASLLLTLRGTPFIYYGDEIGMENADIPRKEMKDRYGKLFYPFYKGRDKARTPMQWNDSKYAGFSSIKPWISVHSNYTQVNVEKELSDKNSLLNLYRTIIRIRKQQPALLYGDISFLNPNTPGILAYQRVYKEDTVFIFLNFTARDKSINLPLQPETSPVLFSNTDTNKIANGKVTLNRFGILIIRN